MDAHAPEMEIRGLIADIPRVDTTPRDELGELLLLKLTYYEDKMIWTILFTCENCDKNVFK